MGPARSPSTWPRTGPGIAGSYQAVYPGGKAVAGTVTGSVTAPSGVTITVRVPNYWPLVFGAALDPGLDSMTGTATENGVPYSFQLVRQ